MISVSSANVTDACLARNGYAYPVSSTNFTAFDPRYTPSLKSIRPQFAERRRNTRSEDDRHSQTSTLWLHRKKRSVSRPATDKTSLRTRSIETRSSIWDDASTIFHSAHFGFEFDCSCMDYLDDQLISSPNDAFADVCWADAVHDDLLDESHWVMSPLPQRSISDSESDEEGSTNVSGATRSTETLQDWCSDDDSMDDDLKKRVHFTTDPPVFFTAPDDESIFTFERYLAGTYSHNPNESIHFFPEGPRRTEISRVKRMASVLKLRRR